MSYFKKIKLGISLSLSVCLLLPVQVIAAQDPLIASVFQYVNQYRAQHGLSALILNPVLSQEATQHSQDMAAHRLPVGHDGFDQRMKHVLAKLEGVSSGAENVAYRYPTAKIVVDGWMHSPGHRRNILGHYTLTGIGVARDEKGHPYYTQMFLKQNKGGQPVSVSARMRRYHG